MFSHAVPLSESSAAARWYAASWLSTGIRCASYTVATHRCAPGRFGSVARALRAASSALANWLFWRRSLQSRTCSPARTIVFSFWAIASPSAAGVAGLPLETANSAAYPDEPMSRTRMCATSPLLRSSVPMV